MGATSAVMMQSNLTCPTKAVNASFSRGDVMAVDEQGIEQIYRRYGGMIRRRCLSILRSEEDADDAMQEVFIRALRSIDTFRGHASQSTWLYRIATNICLNRIRDSRNRDRLDREVLTAPEPEQPVESWPRDLVVRVMSGFDKYTRETVMYSIVEEMTHREIAVVMDCPVSLVRKRILSFKERAPKRAAMLLRAGA